MDGNSWPPDSNSTGHHGKVTSASYYYPPFVISINSIPMKMCVEYDFHEHNKSNNDKNKYEKNQRLFDDTFMLKQ